MRLTVILQYPLLNSKLANSRTWRCGISSELTAFKKNQVRTANNMTIGMFQIRALQVASAMALVIAGVFWMYDFDRSIQVDSLRRFAPNVVRPVLPITSDEGVEATASVIEIGGALRPLPAGTSQVVEVSPEDGDFTDELVGDAYFQGGDHKRFEAISRLGSLQNPQAELTLVSLLDDYNPSIREAAVEALGTLRSGSAIQGLAYALSDADLSIRRSAIEMLAEIGSDEAIFALTMTLSDGDSALREAAVYELIDVHSPAALGLLEQFLSDDDSKVRQLASDYLITQSERYNE